jgi:hypothetical protein
LHGRPLMWRWRWPWLTGHAGHRAAPGALALPVGLGVDPTASFSQLQPFEFPLSTRSRSFGGCVFEDTSGALGLTKEPCTSRPLCRSRPALLPWREQVRADTSPIGRVGCPSPRSEEGAREAPTSWRMTPRTPEAWHITLATRAFNPQRATRRWVKAGSRSCVEQPRTRTRTALPH